MFWRSLALLVFGMGARRVELADYAGKAQLSYTTKNLSCDVRAARYVAHVLGKHFFLAILTDVAGPDNNLRHCCNYRSVKASCYAIHK